SGGVREFEERMGTRLEIEVDDRLGRSHSEIRIPGTEAREGRPSGARKGGGGGRSGSSTRGTGPVAVDET
ncbi:MAG: hypothetical protein ACKO2K_02755, partial [Alphaproteobacteria bacterium]